MRKFRFGVLFVALSVLLMLGAPNVGRLFSKERAKANASAINSITELSHNDSGEWEIELPRVDFPRAKILLLDPATLEDLELQAAVANLIITKGNLLKLKELKTGKRIPLKKNKFKYSAVLINQDGVVYGIKSKKRSRLVAFNASYHGNIRAFELPHDLTVSAAVEGNLLKLKRLNNYRSQVLVKVDDSESPVAYLINLLAPKLPEESEPEDIRILPVKELPEEVVPVEPEVENPELPIEKEPGEPITDSPIDAVVPEVSAPERVPNSGLQGSSGAWCCESGAVGDATICMSCPGSCYFCGSTPVCGNGNVEEGEGCDDGNQDSGDGCSSTCQSENARCGNSILESGEQCDDGNRNNGDGCSEDCYFERAYCGNGKVDPGEECDDGNRVDKDYCTNSCVIAKCGDGIPQEYLNEECDDGNTKDGDGCTSSCLEECDFEHVEVNKAVEGRMYILQFTPANSSESCELTEVTVSDEQPKNQPIKNFIGRAGEFDWKYQQSKEQNLIYAYSYEHKWYGFGDGVDSCIEGAIRNSQAGKYRATASASFKNGTKANKEIEIDVDIDGRGQSSILSMAVAADRHYFSPTVDLVAPETVSCCIEVTCPTNDCISAEATVSAPTTDVAQYNDVGEREELYHNLQQTGVVVWEAGGITDERHFPLTNMKNFSAAYSDMLSNHCATAASLRAACAEADRKAVDGLKKAVSHFLDSVDKFIIKNQCFMEEKAKSFVGATREKGGIDYQCGYVLAGGECPAKSTPAFYVYRVPGQQ